MGSSLPPVEHPFPLAVKVRELDLGSPRDRAQGEEEARKHRRDEHVLGGPAVPGAVELCGRRGLEIGQPLALDAGAAVGASVKRQVVAVGKGVHGGSSSSGCRFLLRCRGAEGIME